MLNWLSFCLLSLGLEQNLIDSGQAIVQSAPQLQFKQEGEAWVVDGTLYRKEDLERVRELVGRARGAIHNRAELSKDLEQSLRPQRKSAATLREPLFLEIAFVELTKNFLRDLGFRFGSPFQFSTQPQLSKELLGFQSSNPIASMLDFALKHGHARVHHKQSLVTVDGEVAEFFSGGELNLRSLTESYAGISTISYGMRIRFLPKMISKERLAVQLRAEISQPDYSNTLDGIPVIQRKKLNTRVQGEMNKTMAVAGLLHELRSQGSQGIAVLSEIPVLGRLFESRAYRERRSEAYIFLTFRRLEEEWMPEVSDE